MAQSLITFIKGDKVGATTDYRDALPVNMYAVERPMFGAKGCMIQAPGLTQVGEGPGIARGGVWNDVMDTQFRVMKDKFVEVAADGSVTELGTISGSGPVSMPLSFNTQAIVADGKYFLYDRVDGFRQVTDADLGAPIDGVWVDGYYFFTDGQYLFHTNISDEAAFDPLRFGTAEFIPDYTYGVAKTEDNKVMVFGRYSVEYFVNSATEDFSFQRVEARAMKIGIVGTHCKTQVSGSTYILGGRMNEALGVHLLNVGSAERVSTREVEKVLSSYNEPDLRDVVMESVERDGVTLILIHLPNETLVFNQTIASSVGLSQAWSIFKSDIYGDLPWRARHGVFDNRTGSWIFGDRWGGTLGRLEDAVATQYGNVVEWILYTPFMQMEAASIDEVDIETIPGFTGDDDATVFVSLTYDGITYGREWTEMYGLPADYNKRFIVRRLGYVTNWAGLKLRGATRSRMAFSRGIVTYG